MKVKDVRPVYPPAAQRARISGMVMLEATIDKRGKVVDLRVLRSVPELDRAALDAVSKWEYAPSMVNGVAVDVTFTVVVTFSIDNARPQMGTPVPGTSAWPTQPQGAARQGMGRGFTSSSISIKQDGDSLTMTRKFADGSEEIKYRFDGRASHNKLPGTGGAVDNTYSYVSRWEGEKLVSTVTWTGPQGLRERTETMWLEGDLLKIQTSRAPVDPAGEPFVQTNVFTRRYRILNASSLWIFSPLLVPLSSIT